MSNEFPLTFQQQWLWSLLREHGAWRCFVVNAFRLKGALSIEVLQRSLDEVVRRHGSLRAKFIVIDGQPQFRVAESQTFPLRSETIAGSSRAEIEEKARRVVEGFSEPTCDPAVGPWVAFRLLNLGHCGHWFVLGVHRLIADCTSIDQVVRELWLMYEELQGGQSVPLLTGPSQYSDYAVWQARSDAEWITRHSGYWGKRLAGAMSVRWPTDERSQAGVSFAIGRMSRSFGEELSAELREFAKRARTLSANVMLAVYVAVVSRWCGQKDFVVPFKIAGRQSQHKSVVGYFTQILYLRIQLDAAQTFNEVVNHVAGEFFRALSHQDFGRIATQRPELLSGTFFQWITWRPDKVLEGLGNDTRTESGLTVERLPLGDFGGDLTAVPPGTVDVEITFFDTAQGIRASGVYRADRFVANTMGRLLDELRSAAEDFVGNPDSSIELSADRNETVCLTGTP